MSRNLKTGLIIGGIVLVILVVLPLIVGLATGWQFCGYETKEYHMMGPWMMGGFGFGWFMPIVWIVIIGLIVWAVIALTKRTSGTSIQDPNKHISALEILKERYARGEIGKDEFEEKRKDLI